MAMSRTLEMTSAGDHGADWATEVKDLGMDPVSPGDSVQDKTERTADEETKFDEESETGKEVTDTKVDSGVSQPHPPTYPLPGSSGDYHAYGTEQKISSAANIQEQRNTPKALSFTGNESVDLEPGTGPTMKNPGKGTGIKKKIGNIFQGMKKPPSESQPRFIQRIAPFTLRDGFSNTDESYKLNLAEVQRYRLHKLRKAVIKAVFDIQVPSKPGGKEGPEKAIDDALRAYIRALQDHDYMQSSLASRARDPFEFAGWRLDDRKLFESVIGELDGDVEKRKSDLAQDHERVPIGYGWETESDTIRLFSGLSSQSRSREESSAFIHRLVIAAFGAAFLIGPMWLMMLRTELWTKLISTTVFVAVFGLIMAYFVKEDNDVLSSTAAYAAVLVVFVGLSSES